MYIKLSQPEAYAMYPFEHRIGNQVRVGGDIGTIVEGHFTGSENAGSYKITYDIQVQNGGLVPADEANLEKIPNA